MARTRRFSSEGSSPQLEEDRRDVLGDRCPRHNHLRRDLTVRQPPSHELEDLELARRQIRQP